MNDAEMAANMESSISSSGAAEGWPEASDLAALLEATAAIMSNLDLETVLRAVAKQMARLIGVEGCAFFRWYESTQTVQTWVAYGTDLDKVWRLDQPGHAYALRDYPLMTRVLEDQIPLSVHVDDPHLSETERTRLQQFGLKSVLRVPVVARERVVALVELLEGRYRYDFGPRSCRLAQTLAGQAAIAIENARLFQERERRITELSILNEISRDFSSALELDELLETVQEQVGRLFDTHNFYVAVRQGRDGDWTTAFQLRRGKRQVPQRFALESDLGGYVARTQQPILLRNRSDILAFREQTGMLDGGEVVCSWMGVPLVASAEVVGVMSIYSCDRENLYDGEDLALLHTIGSQAAVAIENARLYSRVQQQLDELRQAYGEVRRTQDQLIRAQKMEAVGVLAAGVAHDFNNILTVIGLHTEQALQGLPPSSPLFVELDGVRQATLRATALTRQLLLFSSRQPMSTQPLDLGEQVHTLYKMLCLVTGKSIRVHHAVASDLWMVRADPGAIEQVIMNLVVNARDAMPDGGDLNLQLFNVQVGPTQADGHPRARPGPFVCLAVEDNGTGMDEETMQQVFEPFFTTKAPGKGTGLGLAVVQNIVERHNGWVEVRSTVGKGSRFEVFLPAIVEGRRVELGRPPALPPGQGECVLVVEDDASLRAALEQALSGAGYEVLVAPSAQEARLLFEQHSETVALLLSDVVLPDERGYFLADALTVRQPGMRVLLISGFLKESTEWVQIRESGYPFLPKPFSNAELLRRVHEILREEERGGSAGR